MIDSEDLTFVVQGPIVTCNNATRKALNSIRYFYPKSKIIISTWMGSVLTGLDYDLAIENPDPGAKWLYYSDRNILNNNNRQIVSTISGLRRVNTRYSVKTRSDIVFTSQAITSLIFNRSNVGGCSRMFSGRIISPTNLVINPRRVHKMPFHPSDFFYAGDTVDLIKLFDIPLMSDEEMTWFSTRKIPISATFPALLSKYANEQYILKACMDRAAIPNKFSHAFDSSSENIALSESVLGGNFDFFNSIKIGINSLKYNTGILSSKSHVYTQAEVSAIKSGRQSNQVGYPDLERVFSIFVELIKRVYRRK